METDNKRSKIALPIFLLVVFVIAIIALYSMSSNLRKAAKLDLSTPATVTTSSDKLVVSGQADKGAAVSVDGNKVKVDSNGNFSYTDTLKDGVNKIDIVTKPSGSLFTSSKTITATKNPTTTVATTEQAPATSSATSNSNQTSTSTTQTTTSNDSALAQSGPADTLFGSLGLTLLLFSTAFWYRTRQNSRETSYKLFT